MNILSIAFLAAFAQAAAPAAPPYTPGQSPSGDPTFQPASITAKEDSVIPAEVDGVLTQLPVRDGMRVAAGQVCAAIDDRQALAAVEMADLSYQAAAARAEDDVEEVFAIASAKFAELDLRKDLQANQGAPNAVTDIQIAQKKLALRKATLQTDKARKDRVIATKEADVKKAELKAAQINLDRRTLHAPFDGEVQQVFQKRAQWVNPGDPILRLVRFDVLNVECMVNSRDFDPVDLANRRVTVRVNLAREREVAVEGRVSYISQTVLPSGGYLVRAEVQNQRNGDFWLLRPGLDARMTIHVSEPPVDAAQSAALPK